MGEDYRALDTRLDRTVAEKFFLIISQKISQQETNSRSLGE